MHSPVNTSAGSCVTTEQERTNQKTELQTTFLPHMYSREAEKRRQKIAVLVMRSLRSPTEDRCLSTGRRQHFPGLSIQGVVMQKLAAKVRCLTRRSAGIVRAFFRQGLRKGCCPCPRASAYPLIRCCASSSQVLFAPTPFRDSWPQKKIIK